MESPFLTAALEAIERGHTVFPIRDKQPLTKFVNGDPATSLASTSEQAAQMAKRFPRATGAGIKLDEHMGVYDCDTRGAISWCRLNLPMTYTVRTGRASGGAHFYVRLDSPLRHNPALKVPGLEFKTLGGYVVAPGSQHHSGGVYTVANDAAVAAMPAALAKAIGPPRPSQDTDATDDELSKWDKKISASDGPLVRLAAGMADDEMRNVNSYLRRELPEGDEWGRKFFGQAAHLGRWVGQGLLQYDAMVTYLYAIFDELDDGRGGAKGEAHVKRSIRRGLAAGARNVT